jgi:hypothetical protein
MTGTLCDREGVSLKMPSYG